MEARDSFGYWVRRRRKSLDLTQEELAQRVGCALVTLRKIEADERRPSPQMAERLAHGLALPPSEWADFAAAAAGTDTVAWLEKPSGRYARPPGNLPAPVTSLIGREQELALIIDCLQRKDVRLVTLTGPVGVGKTRLAIEAGRRLQQRYQPLRDGAYLVELATVRDPGLVLPVIATILGVREGRRKGLAQLLADYLADRRLLLILDNFEHLLAAAPQLAALLATCPDLKMLVTSRARLHLYGEHELVISPLSLPDPENLVDAAGSAAVRLFCARAQAVRADFSLSPSLIATVAAICRHLDGLPLAIELAAANIRVFSPQELLRRLEHDLPTDFPGAVSPLPRLHVLRNAVSWSYNLLSQTQQKLFMRLAVFAGGFELKAAQAVCCDLEAVADPTDIDDDIGALLDQSLLMRETAPVAFLATQKPCPQCPVLQLQEDAAVESRFVMLETISEFARERLQHSGELGQLRQRHAGYYAGCAQQMAAHLHGPAQALALIWLERNKDNLRAALTWLLNTQQIEQAAELGCALGAFWQRHGHYGEGRRWLDKIISALAQSSASATLRARTLQTAAMLAYRQGDWQIAQPWLAECDAIFAAAGDLRGQASVHFDRGWIAVDLGDWEMALHLNCKSLALARAADDDLISYRALTNLGWAHLCIGECATATPYFEEAHLLAQRMQHIKGIAVALTNLGWVAFYTGNLARAQALAKAGLRLCCPLNERELMAECLELLAIATVANGDANRAAILSGAAAALRTALHIGQLSSHHTVAALAVAEETMRRQLNDKDFETARRTGWGLRLEAVIILALGCEQTAGIALT
jgi:predicted ATPase/transcriptional regulator with XRE-family HTH domain